MAYLHEHHESHEPTIVEERDGVSAAVIAIGVILLVALLVWLFAFSGVVFDRGPAQPTRIENNQTNTNPGTTDGGGTTTTTQPTTQPTSS